MKEQGKVIEFDKTYTTVEIDSKGGCTHCGINNYCHTTGTAKRKLRLKTEEREFHPGELVEIETSPQSLLSAAFLVFILPLIFSSAGYAIAVTLTDKLEYGLISFFSLFILSELLIGWIDKSLGHGQYFEPRIVRKLK